MRTRTLGRSGFEVSEIGLGCWQLGNDFGALTEQQSTEILNASTEAGIQFLDTADVYGGGLSEERLGKWLKHAAQRPLIATKVGRDGNLYPDGYTREKVKANIAGSAKRLGVEALDLVQLHCVPENVLYDGDLLSWMEDFQQEGLIRAFGASVEMIDQALFCLKHPKLTSLQILFNVFRQDACESLLPAADAADVGIIVRLPLASGLLSGKMRKDQQFEAGDHRHYNRDGAAFHVGETFNGLPFETGVALAEQLQDELDTSLTLQQVALRWILDQPQVSTIIAGASRAEQVRANAAVSDLPALGEEQHVFLRDFYYTQVREHIRGGI